MWYVFLVFKEQSFYGFRFQVSGVSNLMIGTEKRLPFSAVIDSAELFGPELTSEGLLAGCFFRARSSILLTPDT